MILTDHAIERYRQRVEDVPDGRVREILDTKTIRAAIQFGAPTIRLACGAKLIVKEKKIVTVLPPPPKRGKGKRHE